MLFSPAMRFGSNNCSPCKGSCVKPSYCPPPCPEDAMILAGKFPWRKYFQCLTREELEELLEWANQYRINHIGSPALSVIYAALHFLTIGDYQEMLEASYLSHIGSVGQLQEARRSNHPNDGWALTTWGKMWLSLNDHAINFIAVGA